MPARRIRVFNTHMSCREMSGNAKRRASMKKNQNSCTHTLKHPYGMEAAGFSVHKIHALMQFIVGHKKNYVLP